MVQSVFTENRTFVKILYYGITNGGKRTNLESIKKYEDSFEIQNFLKDYNISDTYNYFCPKTLDIGKFISKNLIKNPLDELSNKPDGIIFVVDSQKEKLKENLFAWNNLKKFLGTFDWGAVRLIPKSK